MKDSRKIRQSIKIHKSSGIREALAMYDFQNIELARSHGTVVN